MDEDDRDSNGSSENEQDEIMEDADEMEVDHEAEVDEEDAEDEEEEDQDADVDAEADGEAEGEADAEPDLDESQDKSLADGPTTTTTTAPDTAAADATSSSAPADPAAETIEPGIKARSPSAAPSSSSMSAAAFLRRLRPRPEAVTAALYDIVPTMAAPQATSINALAATPDMRFWMTGGADGYVRKYDGAATINGRQLLTVAQRHPFVDSVVKAGVLMSYWENEEPPSVGGSGGGGGGGGSTAAGEHVLSPVYSLAVHSQALWLLSGLESGGINLQSVRHDEGKRIHVLREGGHVNAVSALSLAPDERSVLSGSWDKTVLDWDLNNGQVIRKFEGSGGQISALELRPASGAPIPAAAGEEEIKSETIQDNNDRPMAGGAFMNGLHGDGNRDDLGGSRGDGGGGTGADADMGGMADGKGSPAHESLFGSPAGSLFGDNDTMGGGAFGGDDDDEFSRAMEMTLGDDSGQHGMDHSRDFGMGDAGGADMSSAPAFDPEAGPPPAVQPPGDATTGAGSALTNDDALLGGDTSRDTFEFEPTQTATDTTITADDQPADGHPPPTSPGREQPPNSQQSTDGTAPTASQPQPQSHDPSASSAVFVSDHPPPHHDPTQASSSTFLSASIDGTIRIWDKRAPNPVARIGTRPGVPPWCMGACWSPDGNMIYAGRRNGTVEEYSIHHARGSWVPDRVLKFPAGSGPVTCVRPMVNGRHLICASHDILRLYDLRDTSAFKHSAVPFLIVPGPPRAGVISALYIDPTSRFMLSAAGTRGWDGTSTEVLLGYEIGVSK